MLYKFAWWSICCLAFLTPDATAQTQVDWLSGSWDGIGYQAPTDSKWAVELNYDARAGKISISYPDLSCGGHWEVVEVREGFAEFREVITEGKENCDSQVQVIVTRIDEQYVSVAYFLPDQYDGVVAYSVLRKKPKASLKVPIPGGRDKKT